MGNTIAINSSPKNLRTYLAKGDDHEDSAAYKGGAAYDGQLTVQAEVDKAVSAACSEGQKPCKEIAEYVKGMGWQVKVEKVGAVKEKEALKSTQIKGYWYTFNGISTRNKGDQKWRVFGKSNYGGFGVDNGDGSDKAQFQLPSKGLKYVAFDIKKPDSGSFALPDFKVEVNGDKVEPGDKWSTGAIGTVKLKLDPELFPKGKLLKFQIVFKPGDVNFVLENPRVLGN